MRRFALNPRHRQRGWIGLIVLLVALVIVGMLMKTVLQQYGMTGKAAPATKGMALDPMAPDVSQSVPPPANAIERARGVEANVQQQASDIQKRIDDAAK